MAKVPKVPELDGDDGACLMTNHQFQIILRYLQVVIAILGLIAGVMLAFAWQYLQGNRNQQKKPRQPIMPAGQV
jgi:heme/copper-type cytochrome/quinol oxidase subunit 2